MTLRSLSSYLRLPGTEITYAKIINTCVCMHGMQGCIYVGLYVLQMCRNICMWMWKSEFDIGWPPK